MAKNIGQRTFGSAEGEEVKWDGYASRPLSASRVTPIECSRSRKPLIASAGSRGSLTNSLAPAPRSGANLYEADQAMSARDFVKCVGIAVKELNESKFRLRTIARRGWIKPARLTPLLAETDDLLRMFNAMLIRTKAKSTQAR